MKRILDIYNLLKRNIFNLIYKILNNDSTKDNQNMKSEKQEDQTNENEEQPKKENQEDDENVMIAKTILSRLCIMNQKILVFRTKFPQRFAFYENQINELKESYNKSMAEFQKGFSYEINPEQDIGKITKLNKLEEEIEIFIQKDVKYDDIKQRLQKLILKLNILENVSITHRSDDEQEKATKQTQRATLAEFRVVEEFKECKYLIEEMKLKEDIINLISYLDYEIFKLYARNSDILLKQALNNLVIMTEFDCFNYYETFMAFLADELLQIGNLIKQIKNVDIFQTLDSIHSKIYSELIHSSNEEETILNKDFWTRLFKLETDTFNVLHENGIDKNSIRIEPISQINITLEKKDVLTSPKSETTIELLKVFSKTQDDKVLLVLKLLENISNNITYREIYFLLVLFDIIDTVENHSSELFENIGKYSRKYYYEREEIEQKKKQVLEQQNSEYVFVFSLKEYEQELLKTLKKLNMDFENENNNIFLNKYYFSGLATVINILGTTIKN